MKGATGLLLLLPLLLLAGCKPRQVADGPAATQPRTFAELDARLEAHRLRFGVMSFKGQADLLDFNKNSRIGFSYRIDVARDSLMLVSLSKFGVPAATLLLTRDTVFIRLPLSKTAAYCDYAVVRQLVQLDLDYASAQALLLGEPQVQEPVEFLPASGRHIALKGRRGPQPVYWNLNGATYRLEKMQLEDPNLGAKSEIIYGDFKKVEGQPVAHTLVVDATETQLLRIELHHSAIAIDKEKVNFKFRVPDTYTIVPCDQVGKQ